MIGTKRAGLEELLATAGSIKEMAIRIAIRIEKHFDGAASNPRQALAFPFLPLEMGRRTDRQ